jgi:hypothetical protein
MRERKQRIFLIAAAMLIATVSPPKFSRADELDRIVLVPTSVYTRNNRGRVLIKVTNNNSEILDIEVTCQFLGADGKPAGVGHSTVPRLAPHRQDTVEVTDEIAYEIVSAQCAPTKVRR